MRAALLFYLAGLTTALLWLPLPGLLPVSLWWSASGVVLLAALVWFGRARVLVRAGVFIVGATWAGWQLEGYLSALPDLPAAGTLRTLSGSVQDFPRVRGGRRTLLLAPVDWPRAALTPAPVVRVEFNQLTPSAALGDWCVLRVRLRPLHSRVNPGSRDRERVAAAAHIVARAVVVAHPANVCVDVGPRFGVSRLRLALSEAVTDAVDDAAAGAALRALAVADRSALNDAQWQRMRDTGTSHLLAISGLHISLTALTAFFVLRAIVANLGWRHQGIAAIRVAWVGALLAALAYAVLAGFAVPAQRALVMVATAAIAALRGRPAFSSNNLLLALVIVATLDPLVLLTESLWLSFAAVAVLLLLLLFLPRQGGWLVRALRVHVGLACGLAPLTALLFGHLPLVSPLANLVAVPWTSFAVVPLVLLANLATAAGVPGAAQLWLAAAAVWRVLEWLLDALAALAPPLAMPGWIHGATFWLLALMLVLVLLPRAFGGRAPAAVLLVALLAVRPSTPPHGAFNAVVFDVGQGLAVLVQTRTHALLYDTGPRWPGQPRGPATTDIVPALGRLGVGRLDAVVVSHDDLDHAGGLAEVLAAVPVTGVYAAPDSALRVRHQPCGPGSSRDWSWSGVSFRWLHPAAAAGGSRNDRSCVLAVRSAYGTLLLSGDIEAAAEAELVRTHGAALASDVLVVPHHGSRTSSTGAFIDATRPRYALVSSGYGNRYGLPHVSIRRAYTARGVQVMNTAESGALIVTVSRDGVSVRGMREQRRGFWSGRHPRTQAGR